MLKIVYSYEWRVLTKEGLLTRPEAVGPYYNETTLNQRFDSEEEANVELINFVSNDSYDTEFVLIKISSVVY